MEEPRINLSANERLARLNSGIETEAKHFILNGEQADKALQREATSKFNNQVQEYIDKFTEHSNTLNEYAKEIIDKSENLEIMPIYNYILIKPFAENPFQKITVSDSGLITDLGGQKPIFKNQDNGQIEEEEQFIHVGTVMESGKECKYVKEGDTVMWTRTSEVPVPFFKQGLVLVNENRIMVIVNEGLKKRFEINA